tara:strand:+ start:264 stop:392 length:129 start_codon:yes stop_codon:yes gene_type:complete
MINSYFKNTYVSKGIFVSFNETKTYNYIVFTNIFNDKRKIGK